MEFAYIKLLHIKNLDKIKVILITLFIVLLTFAQTIFTNFTYNFLLNSILYLAYAILTCILIKIKIGYSLIATIISISLSHIIFLISSIILLLILKIFNLLMFYTNPLFIIIIGIVALFLCYLLFKIKKFKYGFSFLNKNNEYIDTLVLHISVCTLLIYFLANCFYTIPFKLLVITFALFGIFMFIIIQKSFIIYQKQKLLEKTLKDYEQEIAESKNKFEILLKEKNNLVKANHEFYHRQQALHLKLDNLIKSNKTLFKEEYGSIIDRIDTLSKEYTTTISNTETQAILPKTNISEIDDMFIYMQNECKKNNIDFTLRLTSDIYQLINNIIPKNKFETLIGDLIRNSIIAINYSSNTNRAIMIILGIKDNTYEFSIYDTGIEFKIETLSKLGLEHATTHADTGGAGIGFITTFETLKYCNASLIITEFSDKNFNYTKSITIKFDSKNNYIIETYRADQFPENQRVKIYPTNIKI